MRRLVDPPHSHELDDARRSLLACCGVVAGYLGPLDAFVGPKEGSYGTELEKTI